MTKRFIFRAVTFIVLAVSSGTIKAQSLALKTNLAYDATTTINVGAEAALSSHWTFDLSANYNPWTFSDNKKLKHWLVQPELRYWTCNKFMGHFFGVHLLGGQFNCANWNTDINLLGTDFSQLRNHRFQGWAVGAGVAYGYAWALSKHFNIEAELGVGYAYTRYDKFKGQVCGEQIENDRTHHYFGPTKLALNLVYLF